MFIFDEDRECGVTNVFVYLTPSEANHLLNLVDGLLQTPPDDDHAHVLDRSGYYRLSFEVVTPAKLESLKNTAIGRHLLLHGGWNEERGA
jgi:hypothetical protein